MTALRLDHVDVRPVLVPLRRPVISRVGIYEQWPLILIDLYTEQGVIGRSYLAPYLRQAVRYIVPAIHDLAAARQGKPIAPLDDFAAGRRALGLVGLEGVSLIAVSGLDMAAWDALAKAAEMPLAVYLGGSLAPVPAYNSNGLWLTPLGHAGQRGRGAGRGGWLCRTEAAARARADRGRRAAIRWCGRSSARMATS